MTAASPLRPCPTPYKQAYPTRGAALAGFWIGSHRRPYLCRCGAWHITSAPPPSNGNNTTDLIGTRPLGTKGRP